MEIPTPLWCNSSVMSASLWRRLSGSVFPYVPLAPTVYDA